MLVAVSPNASKQKATAIHKAVLANSPTLSVAVTTVAVVVFVVDGVVPTILPLLAILGVLIVKLTTSVVLWIAVTDNRHGKLI